MIDRRLCRVHPRRARAAARPCMGAGAIPHFRGARRARRSHACGGARGLPSAASWPTLPIWSFQERGPSACSTWCSGRLPRSSAPCGAANSPTGRPSRCSARWRPMRSSFPPICHSAAGLGFYTIPFTTISLDGAYLPMYLFGLAATGIGEPSWCMRWVCRSCPPCARPTCSSADNAFNWSRRPSGARGAFMSAPARRAFRRKGGGSTAMRGGAEARRGGLHAPVVKGRLRRAASSFLPVRQWSAACGRKEERRL